MQVLSDQENILSTESMRELLLSERKFHPNILGGLSDFGLDTLNAENKLKESGL